MTEDDGSKGPVADQRPGAAPPSGTTPVWGAALHEFHEPQPGSYAPFPAPRQPRASSRARTALITVACVAGVTGVVLLLVFTGHRSANSATTFTVSMPPMTFNMHTTITIPLDSVSDPGCSVAEDALSTATDTFGHDISDPAASAADVQKAIDQAGEAAAAAQSPALKAAVAAMKTHLVTLHSAAESRDFGAEASALQPIRDDITAVFDACRP